jgi:mRNA interferase YafQ
MFIFRLTSQFKRDFKLYKHNKVVLEELDKVLDYLARGIRLPVKNVNHCLVGEFKDCFDCHIKPDVLLVYKIKKAETTILLLRIGSHSEIF